MKQKLFRVLLIPLLILFSGFICYKSLHNIVEWQTTKINVYGTQIAKRISPSQRGDRFYILLDSQYGVIEIPCTYHQYISSSNNAKVSFRIKLLNANRYLEDTSKLQEEHPILCNEPVVMGYWLLSLIFAVGSFFGSIFSIGYTENKYFLIWFGVNFLGAIIGLIY